MYFMFFFFESIIRTLLHVDHIDVFHQLWLKGDIELEVHEMLDFQVHGCWKKINILFYGMAIGQKKICKN